MLTTEMRGSELGRYQDGVKQNPQCSYTWGVRRGVKNYYAILEKGIPGRSAFFSAQKVRKIGTDRQLREREIYSLNLGPTMRKINYTAYGRRKRTGFTPGNDLRRDHVPYKWS